MELKFERIGDVLRVDIRGRETADQTRELAEAVFAERERQGVTAVLMRVRESRTIFKVEQYGLTGIFARIAAIPGFRLAVVADDAELHAAHQYIEVLARQRAIAYRAFKTEAEALSWLNP